jgi:hypothetical protein
MFTIVRRRVAAVRGVEFCEACAQVCTAECRSQARLDRSRTLALQYPLIR